MKDLAQRALDTAVANGATYAEVRVENVRQRYLSTKNGQPAQVRESESHGLGVRVIAEGAWGFAATDELTSAGVDRAAARVTDIAPAIALRKKQDVRPVPEQTHVARWQAPCRIDPFKAPVSAAIELLP